MRRLLPIQLLIALLVCATSCVSSTSLSLGPPAENASRVESKGYLLIVGGGGTTADMYKSALDHIPKGEAAKVVIFPQASELPDTGESAAAAWRENGVEPGNVRVVADVKKDEAGALEAVKWATIIWFPGGVQKRLMEALGAQLPPAIRKRYQEGAVIGGTSAGAAVMSGKMITGEYVGDTGDEGVPGNVLAETVRTEDGLGLIDWAIVDQHFFKRRRFNRLLSCVLDNHKKLIGIGIDERTAILVHGTSFKVIGESTVLVIDARKADAVQDKEGLRQAAMGMRMSLLAHGMSYDVADD